MQQGRYREAADPLRSLADRRCDPRVSLLLAASLEGSGDLAGAEQVLEQAHVAWPKDDRVSVSLAREYFGMRETGKAVQALAGFDPEPSTPFQELEMAALVLLEGHQLPAAQQAAQVAYTAYPSVRSLLLLANTLQLEGKYKDVLALLEPQRATYSQSAPYLVTFAESEYDAKMFDPARADLEQAIALQPDLYQSHYLLGNVLSGQGDLDRAVAEYHTAISLAPAQPRTWYQLALTLRAKEDESGEEDALKHALAIDNHYAPAHSELGRILFSQSRLDEAVAQLDLAVQDNPANEQPYYLLSKAYDRLGDTEKSTAMARRLVEVKRANRRSAGVPAASGAAQ